MEKFARNAPSLAVVIALVIQVERVSGFGTRIGAGWLAWVFAAFLAGTIFVLSYWNGRLKYEITAKEDDRRAYAQQLRLKRLNDRARRTTWLWLALFLFIDGSLNLAETMANLPADVTIWERGGAAVYGVFPTLAAFGLGTFQAVIDRIPAGPSRKSVFARMAEAVASKMEQGTAQGVQARQVAEVAGKQEVQGGDKLQEQDTQDARKLPVQDAEFLAIWTKDPKASDGKVAGLVGITRQAVGQRREKLQASGAIDKTDAGVRVIGVPVALNVEKQG